MVELNANELERLQIQQTVKVLDEGVVYKLDELMDEFGEGLAIQVEVMRWYDDADVTIYLTRDRLETDDEYEARIEKAMLRKAKRAEATEKRRKAAAARKAKKEDEERKLYETLRRKFEKE